MTTLTDVIGLLGDPDLGLTAEQIADVLWLAASEHQRGLASSDTEPTEVESRIEIPASTPATSSVGAEQEDSEPLAADAGIEEPATDPWRPLRLSTGTDSAAEVAATSVALPGAAALRDPIGLARSLRPLKRKARSHHRFCVDVEKSIDATAEARRLVLVYTGEPERWLDVALVVDGGSSMVVWDEAFDELERILAQVGAFRSVTRWALLGRNTARPDEPNVHIRDAEGVEHPSERLVDPSGRRLIIVATDAVSDDWYGPSMWATIERWALTMPLGIVQVLPRSYWPDTALGEPARQLRAPSPGRPNNELEARTAWWAEDITSSGGVSVPVFALSEQGLQQWTNALVRGATWVEGVHTRTSRVAPDESRVRSSARDRVRAFQVRSSSGAKELAQVLAVAGTLSVPLMRVLQARLVPHSGVSELAEIFVGGLLDEEQTARGERRYAFDEEVRSLLQRGATELQHWDVYSAASDYLAEHRDESTSRGLVALVEDPQGRERVRVSDEPFAELRDTLATRFGLSTQRDETHDDLAPRRDALDRPILAYLTDDAQLSWPTEEQRAPLSAVLEWLQQEAGGLLVITGPPRAGKKRLVAVLVALLTRWSEELHGAGITLDWPKYEHISVDVAFSLRHKSTDDLTEYLARWLRLDPASDQDAVIAALSDVRPPCTIVLEALHRTVGGATGVEAAAAFAARLADVSGTHVVVSEGESGVRWPAGYVHIELEAAPRMRNADDDPGDAIELLEAMLADQRRVLGEDHPDTLQTGADLALSLAAAGELERAIALFESVFGAESSVLGEDHRDTLKTGAELADTLAQAGELERAIALFESALAVQSHVLGEDDPDTLNTRVRLASTLGALGRLDESIALFESALAVQSHVLGEDDPDTLNTRVRLASTLGAAGRLDESIALFESALAAQSHVLGEDDPDTLSTRDGLAFGLAQLGELERAIAVFESVFDARRRVLGEDHPDTLKTGADLAHTLAQAGQPDRAIAILDYILDAQQRVLGEDHPDTLSTRAMRASTLGDLGRRDESIAALESVAADQERLFGADDPDTLLTRSYLETRLREAGRTRDAPPVTVSVPRQGTIDLTVRILRGESSTNGRLIWTFEATLGVDVPDEPIATDLGSRPFDFAHQLIAGIASHRGRPTLVPFLNGIGRTMSEQMPNEFFDVLAAVAARTTARPPRVLLLSEEPDVPWELAVLDSPIDAGAPPFLATQADVGRWVLGLRSPRLPPPDEITVRTIAVVSDSDPDAEREAGVLVEDWSAHPIPATVSAVLECLAGTPPADILHFALHQTHGTGEPLGRIILAKGETLDPKLVGARGSAREPLVFVNASQFGIGDEKLGARTGLPEALLHAGVAAVIAPMWPIDHAEARAFAHRFYTQVLERGATPAQALREQRRMMRSGDRDAALLAYRYFGHPSLSLRSPVSERGGSRSADEAPPRFADAPESALRAPVAEALLNKAVMLGEQGRADEAIRVFDEVEARFADAPEPELRAAVATALVNKAVMLGLLGRAEDAIALYDEAEARFGDAAEPELRALVAAALVNKGVMLGGLGRAEDAIAVYDEVEARFADAPESALREPVAKALLNRGEWLVELGRADEAIAVYDKVEARFADAPESELRARVAAALVNKAVVLGGLGRADEAIAVYDEVEARFADAPESELREQVAAALVNKAVVLGGLGRADEAIEVDDQVEARFADAPETELRKQVAAALYNKAMTLGELGRADDAIALYDRVEARFADAPEPELREQVAAAMLNKGVVLAGLNRAHDAIALYDQVEARFADAPESALREPVAKALLNKAVILGGLGRADEAIAVYDEVEARFADAPEPELRAPVAMALLNKAVMLGGLGRADEAIAVFDEVEARFADAPEAELREFAVAALQRKRALAEGDG